MAPRSSGSRALLTEVGSRVQDERPGDIRMARWCEGAAPPGAWQSAEWGIILPRGAPYPHSGWGRDWRGPEAVHPLGLTLTACSFPYF